MLDRSLPPPKNTLVTVINSVLDVLIKGMGVDAALAAAIVEAPWLGWPFISDVFKWFLGLFASALDEKIKTNADIIVIRLQNIASKASYDQAMQSIKDGDASADDLERAKKAADDIIHRGHN